MEDAPKKYLGGRGRNVYSEVAERLSPKINNLPSSLSCSLFRIGKLEKGLPGVPSGFLKSLPTAHLVEMYR